MVGRIPGSAGNGARPPDVGRWVYPVLLAAVMIAGWEAAVRLWEIPHYILPAPGEIATTLVEQFEISPALSLV